MAIENHFIYFVGKKMNYITIDSNKPLKPNACINIGAVTSAGLFAHASLSVLQSLGVALAPAGVAALAIPVSSVFAACLSGATLTLIPHILLHHLIDTSRALNRQPLLRDALELGLFAASLVGSVVLGAIMVNISAPLLGSLVVHGMVYAGLSAITLGITAVATLLAVGLINNTASLVAEQCCRPSKW